MIEPNGCHPMGSNHGKSTNEKLAKKNESRLLDKVVLHQRMTEKIRATLRVLRCIVVAVCTLLPVAAVAHPHVFVDVSLTLRYDTQGRLATVDEVWTYDELYSLLIFTEIADHKSDSFGPAELAALRRIDTNFDPLNGGRMAIESAGGEITTGQPVHLSTELQGDRVVIRRRHILSRPVAGDRQTSIRVYDPSFYVDFSMPSEVTIQGRAGCRVSLQSGNSAAQADAYDTALRDTLAKELGRTGSQDIKVDIGPIGTDFIAVKCQP
ncbi:DUF1007 family protein [Paracoccus sp. JM45]|uniref:DUF1007 family protein n=1 Tax=Paracoccus sp. JM45 TaxID=2283626 RepID=UPI0016004A74|nr:DUF1007 family protein [Paracoccus sp. JM45]